MSKNFNLSIPKKRLRTARFKWGKYFSSTAFSGAALSLVLAGALILPQTAQATDENDNSCELSNLGIIDADGDFSEDPSGSDFKITCTGVLNGDLTNDSIDSIETLLADRGYVPGTSKVLLDISGVTSQNPGIYFASVAALNILTGSLTNDGDRRDGFAVTVQGDDPANNDGTAYDVVAHNRADITVQGEGRRGVRVVHEHDVSTENGAGGSATLVNYGAVTTEGDSFIRPPDRMHRDRRTNALEAIVEGGTGNAMITNKEGAEVITKGTGGRGLHAWTGGTGTATAINEGMVTTEGDVFEGSEFAQSSIGIRASSDHGNAVAENQATGTIETEGVRAHGIGVWSGGKSNTLEVSGTNAGTITTNGNNADGMVILATDSGSEGAESRLVEASNSGMITVNGDSEGDRHANGISAGFWMDRETGYSGDALGTVRVTNTGTVTTTGKSAGAIAAGFWDAPGNTIQNSGNVEINIEDGSTVEASGSNSVAVIADTHGSGNIEINVNNESTTPAEVVEITAGTEDDPLTDEDEAKFGYGIYATANTASSESEDVNDDDDVVININQDDDGSIIGGTRGERTVMIQAYGAATDDENTEDDETKGIAIFADSGGMVNGRSRITINNAEVVAKGFDSEGTIIPGYAVVFAGGSGHLIVDNSMLEGDILFTDADDTFTINDSAGTCSADDNFGKCAQIASGSSIHFRGGDDEMTINADHFSMNYIDITGSPTISFDGDGPDRTVTLQDVRFNANINFDGDSADHLTLIAGVRPSSIKGDIDFGDGFDQLTVTVGDRMTFDLMGTIDGLEDMLKRGPGIARVNNVEFTGSDLFLVEGKLIVSGHLNLGKADPEDQDSEGGALTIGDMTKLVFEVEGTGEGEYGQVTAETLIFENLAGMSEVFVQLSNHLDADQVEAVQAALGNLDDGLNVLNVNQVTAGDGGTTVLVKSEPTDGGTPIQVGTITLNQGAAGMAMIDSTTVDGIEKTGVDAVAPVDAPPSRGMMQDPGSDDMTGGDDMTDGDDMMTGGATTTASSGSSSNAGGAVLGIGLLAVLLNSFLGDDDASASFGDYYFNTPQSAYIASVNERGVMTIKETGNQPYQMWIRTGHTAQPMQMTGVSNTGVSGTEVGVNLYNSDTFYINTSVAPNVSAEVGSLNLAGKGEVYSLNSGWRNDRYFAGLRLSHGEFEVNSIVDNPIVNSALISNAKLRNTQAQLRAGMNLGTGALRFTPSAAVQVGTYESSEHVADSPALEAAIPSYAQDYTSAQLGLKMTSDKWLSFANGSKWKPQLKFDSIHTDSTDAGSLTLRQSDKAGALSFNTNAGLRSMPEVVNSMSFGATVKSSANDQAEWKFGFAGLEADGEEYYAAMAAYQVRF